MVFLAQGAVDAYIEYGLHSWDMAAAVVIIREAGGIVIDTNGLLLITWPINNYLGSEFDLMSRRVLCASTKELASQLSQLLTHIEFPPEAW